MKKLISSVRDFVCPWRKTERELDELTDLVLRTVKCMNDSTKISDLLTENVNELKDRVTKLEEISISPKRIITPKK